VVLALSVAAPLAAQQTYSLDFAWPMGVADVTVESTISASVMGQPQTLDMEMAYRMEVSEDGDALRISYSDYVIDGVGMEALAESGSPEEMTRLVSNAQADIRVSREGEFLGLADYPALRASMDEMLASQRAELEASGMAGMFYDLMEASLSEESMSLGARVQWDQLAGHWVGRTLAVGESVTVPSEMPFPVMTDTPVSLETELRLVGPVPCPEGSGAGACLELASTASPDPEEMRNLMDVFMADMAERAGGSGMEMGITSMTLEMTSTLVVEASTLRPLRLETRVGTDMEMDVMGMVQTMANEQAMVTRFAWER
jgi:hypothetical protein